MSTVSGLNAKGEKGKSKYVALDINSLYKGKSLENPKATVQPKHGLQSLGKVGAGRRMPPPANLPSLKSENSGNNPNISLVPSGGQGWGSATKEKGKTEESSGNQQQSPQLQPVSSHSQAQKTQGTPNTVGTPGVSKTWSSVTSNQEDGGQERNFLGQQSPFFPQEFPKLAGGDAQTEGNQKSSADSQYGPGPSLRPQTEGSWGRGTLQQHQQQQQQQQQLQPGLAGGPQQSSGSGVNGQPSSENQPLPTAQQHLRDQRPYPAASRGGPLPSNSAGSGASASGSGPTTPVLGPGPPGPGPGMGGQMGPGSALHPPPPQFRGMLPPYMYGRNNFPGGYPSNYSGMPPPPQPTRQPYPYPENRRPQPVRPLAEEEAYQRPAAIITEKALKGFDEILQNDTQDTWAASHGEIDYNAKLVFSDDEETPPSQKKDKREEEEKGSRTYDCGKADRERDLSERERDERNRDVDWGRDGRTDKGSERDIDWDGDRRDAFERDRDDRWKGWTQPPQGRPNPSLGMEMQRQWQSSQQQQRVPFDYRGPPPPPQPPGAPYAPPHMRLGPGPVPPQPQQHPGYPPPRPARPGPRPSSLTDDDELWRQRRKQHSDEMTMAVERARQRREEEEKRYEQSKQSAQEKAKSFEKNEKENKENLDIDDRDRSRHSSESRDEKPPSRDGRDRDRERERERERSQANFQGFGFSRQFQKNVPPRFQKQAEYIRQQQQQQPSPPPAAAAAQQHFIRQQQQQQQQQQPASQGPPPPPPVPPSGGNHGPPPPPLPMNMNYDPRWGTMAPPPYMNQMTGMSVMSKNMPRPRSSSQGSGTDSYESDRCTPDQNIPYERERDHYWNRERRQGMPSVTYDTWRAPASTGGYYDQNTECNSRSYDQRTDFKHSSDKDDLHSFDSHPQEIDRRDREFESQDYRYRGRESYEERAEQKQRDTVRDIRDRETKPDSWSNSREYEERMPDPFDEPSESSQPAKDRPERQERWDKERPQRPDSRDSRTSRESTKEERHPVERQESQSSQSDRERKSVNAREEKKEKSVSIDWGDTPYPMESKRREWHHHPPPITPKQFESLAPPKKNLTTLRRSTPSTGSSVTSDRKTEVQKDDGSKKSDVELTIKKEKEAKEEKNEKIKSETSAKESEKRMDEKPNQGSSDKLKATGQDNQKDNEGETKPETTSKEQSLSSEEKEKCGRENRPEMKDKHETSRNDQQSRDKRREGRDRGGINSRSRGGSAPAGGSGNNGGGNLGRYDSSRGRGGRGSGFGGPGGFRGRSREYRRSRVERGPRFDRQKERDKDKVKEDKKEKHSDESSCSETEDGKLGHLRQKDEDSEVSVDEASASTTESAQAEKYQNTDPAQEEDKNVGTSQTVIHKEEMNKSEKFQKDKRENTKRDSKLTYEFERSKDEKGGFAPRGEPSRRGRGGGGTMSFRNSRGGPRYGPSNYGPPPSKAAFGSGKTEKQEEQKSEDHISKDPAPGEHKDNIQHCDSTNNLFGKELNKSRSLERPQQRRPNRYEHLPPRLQKRQARRYDNFDHTTRGRGRGRSSGYQGTNNQVSNKINQGAKENLSDVANEEWETASESSDVAERRERRDEAKEEPKKKDSRDKGGSSASRKSFSSQRPMNEGTQGRKSGPESRRGGHGNPDRNRQRDGFGRENRGRDSGRGRTSGSGSYGAGNGGTNNGERRLNNNGNNSRPPSSAGHNNAVGGRNSGRGGHPPSKTSPFPPKSEGTAAVYRVDEIKLQDPNSVQAALSDLTNRRSIKPEVAVNKATKTEKEKSGGLEGYDLNNYASVVIIDDHPEVTGDDAAFLCDADDGFQEVTSKKRHKAMVDSDVKKMKKEPHSRNKSGSRSRQSRLPPRFAKQRETSQLNLTKSSVAAATTSNSWDVSAEVSSANTKPALQFPVKDASPAPPPSVNAWEKPITHSLRSHSPNLGQNCSANNTSNSVCSSNSNSAVSTSSSTTTAASDIQVLTTSKSNSFDRSDQHDSGIDVSDQPASAASSQRSSPSNDCKILAPKNSVSSVKIPTSTETCSELVTDIDSSKPMCTVVFENKNFKAENAVLDKFGGQSKSQPIKDITTSTSTSLAAVGSGLAKPKESEIEETKAIRLPVTFSTKEPFGKGEEGTDIKLDFTFDSELAQLTEEKTVSSSSSNSNNSGSTSTKAINMGHSMQVTSVSTTVGVQSPISPSADELNLKIASVKKVWESIPPMPTVLEHPQTVSANVTEESSCPTSFGSFSGNSDPSANSYNTSVDPGPQSRKDSTVDSSEMAFRDSSPLQQSNSSSGLVTKTVDHNTVCAVKSQQVQLPQHGQMTGPHCTGPVSPPLIGGLDTTMTGIRTIAGLASSVQVAGIPAIPSPPTVLFNSSQQMAQTGLYQPLQMDSSQVLSRQSQAAAVAAAMAQFTQPPHGYAPLGTYGLSHQPPSAQLSNAFGQQSLFVQPPTAHQAQDIYPSNQFRVQPPYPQSQHVTSSQVLSAQQNLASSHLLGSQLVQTRPTAGPTAAGPHLQGLHGLQHVQPGPPTSYYSSSAQAQTAASFYHQPPTTPGSPMQQQPQFPSHQGYGSQSALNVLPQAAAVTQNFRNFGSHQFKAASAVMNSMVPESSTSLRSATRSPTMDVSSSRNVFGVGNTTTTTMNSGSVMAVPQISSPGVVGKVGQPPQANTPGSARLGTSSANKGSQYALPQSQQHYYPFGQQKFGHVQSPAVRPQVMFPGVVRNNPHQAQHAAAATNIHYPAPIQRPGSHTSVTQPTPQQPAKVGNRSQVPGGKLTSAQQAKLRAEAVQQTHMFFAQTKTGKPDDAVASILAQEKNGLSTTAASKLSVTSSVSEESKDKTGKVDSSLSLSPVSDTNPVDGKEMKESELPAVEE